jgi:hypothetical protein
MKTRETQTKQKRIEELTLRELDMVYSLARIGDWPDSQIGRVYKLSEGDVRKVFDNYVELREMLKGNQDNERLPQELSPELTKKPRKRRRDARFATPAERQAAYRNRLQERRHAGIEQPSPTADAPAPIPADEEVSGTVCEDPVTEIGPENAVMQHSACHGSSEECSDTSESVPLSVTPQTCDESEALRLIEE